MVDITGLTLESDHQRDNALNTLHPLNLQFIHQPSIPLTWAFDFAFTFICPCRGGQLL